MNHSFDKLLGLVCCSLLCLLALKHVLLILLLWLKRLILVLFILWLRFNLKPRCPLTLCWALILYVNLVFFVILWSRDNFLHFNLFTNVGFNCCINNVTEIMIFHTAVFNVYHVKYVESSSIPYPTLCLVSISSSPSVSHVPNKWNVFCLH